LDCSKPHTSEIISILLSVPAWLRICNGNLVELLHAIDVGNSDGKTAVDICKVRRSPRYERSTLNP
jgi:hypothetical protein